MRIPLAISATSHAAILLAGLVAFPSFRDVEAPPQESIPVELVSIEDVTNVKAGEKKGEAKPESAVRDVRRVDAPREGPDADSPSRNESAAPPPRTQARPTPPAPKPVPVEAPAPEPEPEPEPVKVAEPKPAPEPAPPEVAAIEPEPAVEEKPRLNPEDVPAPRARPTPPPKPVETAKPEPKQEAPRPQEVAERPETKPTKDPIAEQLAQGSPESFDADRISALLDKSKPAPAAAPDDATSAVASLGNARGLDVRLSISEIDALRQQISRCWNPPIGLSEADSLIVKLSIRLNQDGSLVSQPELVDVTQSEFAQVAAESAMRAVSRCQPYSLPQEKYEAWQHIVINFDPRDMFGG